MTVNVGDSMFTVKCYGLKPNTRHYFFINNTNVNKSARCKPAGHNVGDQLVTDALGDIEFNYYFEGDRSSDGGTSTTEMTVGSSVKFLLFDSPTPSERYWEDAVSMAEGSVNVASLGGSGIGGSGSGVSGGSGEGWNNGGSGGLGHLAMY